MRQTVFLLLIVFFASCGSEGNTEETKEAMPNTPESVARTWQKYVDTDQFEEAAALSTPRAQEWLVMIENFLAGLAPEETAEEINTVFTEFNCVENGNIARCGYIIKEEGEFFRDTFILYKIDGQWKVDVPEEEEEEEGDLDGFIDSLLVQ